MNALRIPTAVLAEARRHAEEAFPNECCGALLIVGGRMEAVRFRNVQNEQPAADHLGQLRTAETAFRVDPEDALRLQQRLLEPGAELAAIYHSHPNAAAYFSEMDRHAATAGGAWDFPAYPDHLVISVMDGEAREQRAFSWNEEAADFLERGVERSESGG